MRSRRVVNEACQYDGDVASFFRSRRTRTYLVFLFDGHVIADSTPPPRICIDIKTYIFHSRFGAAGPTVDAEMMLKSGGGYRPVPIVATFLRCNQRIDFLVATLHRTLYRLLNNEYR